MITEKETNEYSTQERLLKKNTQELIERYKKAIRSDAWIKNKEIIQEYKFNSKNIGYENFFLNNPEFQNNLRLIEIIDADKDCLQLSSMRIAHQNSIYLPNYSSNLLSILRTYIMKEDSLNIIEAFISEGYTLHIHDEYYNLDWLLKTLLKQLKENYDPYESSLIKRGTITKNDIYYDHDLRREINKKLQEKSELQEKLLKRFSDFVLLLDKYHFIEKRETLEYFSSDSLMKIYQFSFESLEIIHRDEINSSTIYLINSYQITTDQIKLLKLDEILSPSYLSSIINQISKTQSINEIVSYWNEEKKLTIFINYILKTGNSQDIAITIDSFKNNQDAISKIVESELFRESIEYFLEKASAKEIAVTINNLKDNGNAINMIVRSIYFEETMNNFFKLGDYQDILNIINIFKNNDQAIKTIFMLGYIDVAINKVFSEGNSQQIIDMINILKNNNKVINIISTSILYDIAIDKILKAVNYQGIDDKDCIFFLKKIKKIVDQNYDNDDDYTPKRLKAGADIDLLKKHRDNDDSDSDNVVIANNQIEEDYSYYEVQENSKKKNEEGSDMLSSMPSLFERVGNNMVQVFYSFKTHLIYHLSENGYLVLTNHKNIYEKDSKGRFVSLSDKTVNDNFIKEYKLSYFDGIDQVDVQKYLNRIDRESSELLQLLTHEVDLEDNYIEQKNTINSTWQILMSTIEFIYNQYQMMFVNIDPYYSLKPNQNCEVIYGDDSDKCLNENLFIDESFAGTSYSTIYFL